MTKARGPACSSRRRSALSAWEVMAACGAVTPRYCFCAGSQCSAILPFSIRNMSNQVVLYFLVGVLRIDAFAREAEDDEVALGDDRDQRRLDPRLDRRRLPHLGEEVDERGAPARHVRVVLDVRLGHVLVGELHVRAFEHLAPEVVDEALVGGQARVGAGEQRLPDRRPPAPRPAPKRPSTASSAPTRQHSGASLFMEISVDERA